MRCRPTRAETIGAKGNTAEKALCGVVRRSGPWTRRLRSEPRCRDAALIFRFRRKGGKRRWELVVNDRSRVPWRYHWRCPPTRTDFGAPAPGQYRSSPSPAPRSCRGSAEASDTRCCLERAPESRSGHLLPRTVLDRVILRHPPASGRSSLNGELDRMMTRSSTFPRHSRRYPMADFCSHFVVSVDNDRRSCQMSFATC